MPNESTTSDFQGISQSSGGQVITQMIPTTARGGSQTVLWVIAILLAVIATTLLLRWDDLALSRSAMAQPAWNGGGQQAGAKGIYAFAGQITSKSYGLFMMDVDSGTVWCYELDRGSNAEPQLKLVAARSWLYDRSLEEFNVAEPIPSAVRSLVERQRTRQATVDAKQRMPQDDGTAPNVPALPGGE